MFRPGLVMLVVVVAALVVGTGEAAAAAFGPLGENFRMSFMGVNGSTAYGADSSSVAYNPTANEYLVTWAGDDVTASLVDNEFEIFGQRLSAGGEPVGARIRISDMGPDGSTAYGAAEPSVAYDSAENEYLVVWSGDDNIATLVDNEFEIFGQRLTAGGAEVGVNDFRISEQGPDGVAAWVVATPSVAYNAADDQYLVAWSGDTGVNKEDEIWAQRLTGAGTEVGGSDFRVSDMGLDGDVNFVARDPSVAHSSVDNQWLVTWSGDDDTAPLVDNELEIFGQRLDRTGTEGGENDFRISDMGPDGSANHLAASPSVAYSSTDNEWLVTWWGIDGAPPLVSDEVEIYGQRVDRTGAEAGANDFRISDMGPDGDLSFQASLPSVAYNSTAHQWFVAWQANNDTGSTPDKAVEVFGQRLDGTGTEAGANDFRISGMGPEGSTSFAAQEPSVAYGSVDDQYLVTWHGDDDTQPLVDNEIEIFGQRLGEPVPPGGGGAPGDGGTPGGSGEPPAAFGARTLVTLRLAARRTPAAGPLKVRVANGNGFDIGGRLSGRTTDPVSGARTKRIKLRARAFRVAARAKKTVKLRLPTPLRRRLRRTGKLSLRLTARVKDPAGNTRTVRKRVTPRLKTKRRR